MVSRVTQFSVGDSSVVVVVQLAYRNAMDYYNSSIVCLSLNAVLPAYLLL